MATILVVVALLALVALLVACARFALRPASGPAPGTGTDTGTGTGTETGTGTGTGTGRAPGGGGPAGPGPGRLPRDLAAPAGGLVLLQLSSAFSVPCRDARAVLGDLAAEHPRLVHRDVDLAARPELVRLLAVADTPTTLLVDAHGVELLRLSGVPRRAALTDALAPHLAAPPA